LIPNLRIGQSTRFHGNAPADARRRSEALMKLDNPLQSILDFGREGNDFAGVEINVKRHIFRAGGQAAIRTEKLTECMQTFLVRADQEYCSARLILQANFPKIANVALGCESRAASGLDVSRTQS
jgi:hypothetical protein